MSAFFNREELENLKSLKRDLVNPVKSFLNEVQEDTVGDAKRYYADKARKAEQSVKAARERAAARKTMLEREQAELRRRRREKLKKAAILLVAAAVLTLVMVSLALSR